MMIQGTLGCLTREHERPSWSVAYEDEPASPQCGDDDTVTCGPPNEPTPE